MKVGMSSRDFCGLLWKCSRHLPRWVVDRFTLWKEETVAMGLLGLPVLFAPGTVLAIEVYVFTRIQAARRPCITQLTMGRLLCHKYSHTQRNNPHKKQKLRFMGQRKMARCSLFNLWARNTETLGSEISWKLFFFFKNTTPISILHCIWQSSII